MTRLNRLAAILVTAVMVLAFGAIQPNAPADRIHPALKALATQRPTTHVQVIVQKLTADNSVEGWVTEIGGKVTKDLSIINAFAAELPVQDAVALAANPGVRWVSLDAPVSQAQASNTAVFTTWATQIGTKVRPTFTNTELMVDSALGPNGTYGFGSNEEATFGGFVAEVTPGHNIVKVEVVLNCYVTVPLSATDVTEISVFVAGRRSETLMLAPQAFDHSVGVANAGPVYVDITNLRTWQWSDFDNDLELFIDQYRFKYRHPVYHDAIGLRVTSAPGIDNTGGLMPISLPKATLNTSKLVNVYNAAVRATDVWNEGPAYLQGQGMTVAMVDSGVYSNADLGKRIIANANFNKAYHNSSDRNGHGTFIAGIIGGNGSHSGGQYIGIAPKINLVNVRVSDDDGMANESDTVSALQWIYRNRAKYNIRVVNLSLNSSIAQSYHTSPLDAAVEILWFNGIIVVVSAGNNGTATLFPPANDPFVITVGAMDDKGTVSLNDDVVTHFSAYGTTSNGVVKPDLVAPGTRIVAFLPENNKLTISRDRSTHRVDDKYFRMSGTSIAAPIVSGAVALLLQDEPALNPDQVKYRLMATANKDWPGYSTTKAGAGYLDIYAAIHGTSLLTANTGMQISHLFSTGPNPVTWNNLQWNSIEWASVDWNSIEWASIEWASIEWASDWWGD